MLNQNVTIRPETVAAVRSALEKYKANGGGSEYDDINKYLTPKK